MNYQDIIAAFIVGCLVGSGNIFGGLIIGLAYSRFMREDESD